VVTRAGKEYKGDACICAVPASRSHRIRWHPALPAEQLSAARQLQYARIVKTAFLLTEKFWPGKKTAGFSLFTNRASDFCFESTFGQDDPEGIICSYAIGDKADDLADEPATNWRNGCRKIFRHRSEQEKSMAHFCIARLGREMNASVAHMPSTVRDSVPRATRSSTSPSACLFCRRASLGRVAGLHGRRNRDGRSGRRRAIT
jgi:hypothetical protein